MNLDTKVAFVTGGARGLGKAIAKKLLELNATVIIADINKENLEETVMDLKKISEKCSFIVLDVTNFNEVEKALLEVKDEYGQLDILVNNAGINRDGMLHKMTVDQWNSVIQVNLTGVFNTMQVASNIMRTQESGRIINISSMSWLGNIGQANYAAAKAGVVGITKTASRELAKKGITVNAICPGFIKTDMTSSVPDKVWDIMVSKIPAGYAGEPEEVAKCVAFFASNYADYITGEVINVSGGMIL